MRRDDDWQRRGAFVDAELDMMGQLELEARLQQDPALRADVDQLRRLRDTVRGGADYHRAPPDLCRRIGVLTGEISKPATSTSRRQRWPAWRPAAIAAGVAALLILGGTLTFGPGPRDEQLAQEVIASHVRATLGQRLVDIASSDQHTVKPWLSSKLDFSPPVYTLQTQGVVFLGGRVDYVDERPVAVLVYKRREHVVDVFVWPTSEADRPARGTSERGFNVEHGSRGGMAFWLVSDLNRDELNTLARAFRSPGGDP
jgi:anti-sigma factor RsiW